MDRAVIISIKPKWCELIASGRKTIEVRKTAPKCDTPFKCYIYCTKGKEMLWILKEEYRPEVTEIAKIFTAKDCGGASKANGKVIGEFMCDRIDKYKYTYTDGLEIDDDELLETMLDREEINIYAHGKGLYCWHISDLKIYDTPKELGEFFRPCDGCDKLGTSRCTEEISPCRAKTITRPFQSWGYVEEV